MFRDRGQVTGVIIDSMSSVQDWGPGGSPRRQKESLFASVSLFCPNQVPSIHDIIKCREIIDLFHC